MNVHNVIRGLPRLFANMTRVERNPLVAWRCVRLARGARARGSAQKTSELAPFLALAQRLEPRAVVEIGLGAGGTLWALCRSAAPDATLVSVDLPGGRHGGEDSALADLDHLRSYAQAGQTLHFVRADSHTAESAERVAAFLPHGVDLLFIDGDHTYESVAADFALYAPLVRAGGVVAFHDILPHDFVPDCNVDRFWSELDGNKLELTSPGERAGGGRWGGIGLLLTMQG